MKILSKLIYVSDDDGHVFDIILDALKQHGYRTDHTTSSTMPAADRIHADIALLCQPAVIVHRLTLGGITLDLDSICAYDAAGNSIHFTPIEFSMLSYLMKNAHRAVPRSELLSAVWDFESGDSTRVADDTAKRLRRKLRDSSLLLETVWNYGFRVREK